MLVPGCPSRRGKNEEEDVTLPLMLSAGTSSALERAAFLLHDVLALNFDEVAGTIQHGPRGLPEARRACAQP